MNRSAKIKLSREELYQRVWSTPAVQLAKELGVSDVAIGKRCRRQNIPRPGRGYWTLLAMGKTLPVPHLPPVARAENGAKLCGVAREAKVRPRRSPDTRGRAAGTATQPNPVVNAPVARSSLHPIAERVKNSLLLLKTGENGLVYLRQRGLPRITAAASHALQIARILDTLIHAAGEKQLSIRAEDDPSAPGVVLGRGEATAGLSLEQIKREKTTAGGSPLAPRETSDIFQFSLNLRWNHADLTIPPAAVAGGILRTLESFFAERESSQVH